MIAAAGLAVVGALLFYGLQLNPSDAQAKNTPGAGNAHRGFQVLRDAGVSAGVLKPFEVVVEGNYTASDLRTVERRVERTAGVAGAAAPKSYRTDGLALVGGVREHRRLRQGDAGHDQTAEGGRRPGAAGGDRQRHKGQNLVSLGAPTGSSSSSSRRATAPRRSGTSRRPTRSSRGSR